MSGVWSGPEQRKRCVNLHFLCSGPVQCRWSGCLHAVHGGEIRRNRWSVFLYRVHSWKVQQRWLRRVRVNVPGGTVHGVDVKFDLHPLFRGSVHTRRHCGLLELPGRSVQRGLCAKLHVLCGRVRGRCRLDVVHILSCWAVQPAIDAGGAVLGVPCWFGVQRRVSNRLWWLSRRTVHGDDRVDELLFVRRRSVLVCRERDVV